MSETIYIPIALTLIAAYLWYRCIKQRNSGAVAQNQATGKYDPVPGKVPFHEIGSFVWACVLTACAIGSFVWIVIIDR